MSKSTTNQEKRHFTPRATLTAIGLKIRQLGLFRPIAEQVKIPQKVVHYTPAQKLLDSLITILAGAHGLVEANKRVRPDHSLQRAFGRDGCAEQSVISETLNACTPGNVQEMYQAMKAIYQQHGLGYRHDYQQCLQLLDVDMTGQPCGKKAAFASKGYFAKQRNRRGRQLGRVLATWYEEVLVDRLYDGKTQLPRVFQTLVQTMEEILDVDEEQRQRTILRVDGHGGSQDDVNWALARGYHLHTKEYSHHRARKLAASVEEWYDDPKVSGRQVGWVTEPATEYVRPLRRAAVRSKKKNGQWGIGVLLSTLTPEQVVPLARLPIDCLQDPVSVLLAYVYFYDLRSGGVETQIKGDRQGLGITKRNKKRFEAQEMLTQLNALAHNIVIWARDWLTPAYSRLRSFGILRMVRDVFQVSGLVVFHGEDHLCQIILNEADPLASDLCSGLGALLAPLPVVVNLGEI